MNLNSDLLIIGGGLAAINIIRALRLRGDQRSIQVLGDELHLPYDRPPLSKQFLAGETQESDLVLVSQGEWQDLNADFRPGVRAVALSASETVVTDQAGVDWGGEDVVIATGARARQWRKQHGRILTVRTIDDAMALRSGMRVGTRLAIIGAGFIGLEIASTAKDAGCEVVVIESAPYPLTRVLGQRAGHWFIDLHAQQGVNIQCGKNVIDIQQIEETVMITLDDDVLEADYVVLGIGVTPNVEWLTGSGVRIDDGVVCDAAGRTSRDHVWAVGDVARWRNVSTGSHQRVEQWQAAVDQAQVIAGRLAGEDLSWESVPYFWSDQFGRKIQFAGTSGNELEVIDLGTAPVMIFSDTGRLTGLLAVDKPRLIAMGRRVIARHGTPEEVLALLS